MPWPDSAEPKPPASTTLSGNDGNLAHTAYDTALHQQVARIGNALIGARGTFATIAARLASIDQKLVRIRVNAGSAGDVAVGGGGDDDTGFIFPTNQIVAIAAGSSVATLTNAYMLIHRTLTVSAGAVASGSAKVFFPGLLQSAAGSSAYVRWDATAGELIAATSSRAHKVNERVIADGLALLRRITPTRYDLADTDPAIVDGAERRPGYTDDIPGFIAEDVADVDPALAASTADGTPTGVDVEAILAVVAAAVLELDAKVTALEAGR